VYEYDYKGFFPSLNISEISRHLMAVGMPAGPVMQLEELNKSQPKLAVKDLVDESVARSVLALRTSLMGLMDPASDSKYGITT
jgi:hypothetical protein